MCADRLSERGSALEWAEGNLLLLNFLPPLTSSNRCAVLCCVTPCCAVPLCVQVASLDALSLSPAAVQQEVHKRREQQARGEAAWESMMAQSVGGGGTHLSSEVACPSCGERRAQVHTILSGGTYAQVRGGGRVGWWVDGGSVQGMEDG